MKRCPECGREYDNTMMFCLDDGTELLYGPAKSEPGAIATAFPSDEPQTAILHSTAAPGEAPTRAKMHTTDQTAIFQPEAEAEPQENLSNSAERKSLSTHRSAKPLAALCLAVLVLVGGFLGYRYFSTASLKQIESIAVMPFVNESGNADIEYLSDGMTETLIGNLTQVPNLNVKARATVFRYKGKETDTIAIGKELNVQAILTGRVVQRGDQLTLSLELIDVATENAIWSQRYDRKQSDLVALQSEIARDVSSKLKSRMSGAESARVEKSSTTNPEAYELYLKGRFYWNRRSAESLNKAVKLFKAAIEKDPNYALAYAGLADCYVLIPQETGTSSKEAWAQAKAYAVRALELDDRIAQAHATLGLINQYLWNWSESEKEFKRAIELDPNYPTAYQWYSVLLGQLGRQGEAMAAMKKANQLDPLSVIILLNLGIAYVNEKEVDTAITHFKKISEIDPQFHSGYGYLGLAYERKGQTAEALAAMQKYVEISNRSHESIAFLGYVHGRSGDREKALGYLKEIRESPDRDEGDSYYTAVIYAGMGEKDLAFEWLNKALDERSYPVSYLRDSLALEPLRSDPRFAGLLKRMELPE